MPMTERRTMLKVIVAGAALALAVPAFAFAQGEGESIAPPPDKAAQPAPSAPGLRAPFLKLGRGWGMMHGSRGMLKAVQDVTGLTGPEIRQQLAEGKTLAQIAESKGKTADAVVKAARAAMQSQLDQAVQGGWVTQERADAMQQAFDERAAEQMTVTPSQLRSFGHAHGDCSGMKNGTEGSQPGQPGLWYSRLRGGTSSDT